MTITVAPSNSVERARDAIINLLLGPEYAKFLEAEHARAEVKFGIRFPAVGYFDEVETLDAYPAFELVGGPSTFRDGGREHELSLQWTVNGDDEERMSRELLRLVEAAVQFFEQQDGTLLPWVGGKFRVDRTDTGPTSRGRDEPYVKSAAVRIFWLVWG